ncbi:hypothetical protein ACGFZK_10915 [Streptomyces sp. NPDC048257]|uniref:hypothetical protein n=1 Tax=Streptomyces sp. NPDC048257 TaxID=3365526 RepID=UPI00371112AB
MNPAVYVLGGPDGYGGIEDDWGAIGLDLDLLAGPDVVLMLMRRTCADGRPPSWFADEDVQAGVLVDPDAKVLLLFLLEGPSVAMRTRRAVFALLRAAWPGWEVRWSYGGQTGLRAHVGLDPADDAGRDRPVWPDDVFEASAPALAHPDPDVTVVTVDGPDRCHLMGFGLEHPVMQGPALLDRLEAVTDHGAHHELAESGLHIDQVRRRVGWWHTGYQIHPDTVAARWPGWTVEFWEDRWAEHRAASGGRFDPTEPDDTAALTAVRDAALEHWSVIPGHEHAGLLCLVGLGLRGLTTRQAAAARAAIQDAYRGTAGA